MKPPAAQREAVRTAANCHFLSFVLQIMTLLRDAKRCQFFFCCSSWNIRGRPQSPTQKSLSSGFPPSSSEDDKHLCCEVKIQKFLIFEEHLEHFMSVLSNSPLQSHCSQLELRKWNCSVSPGEHLNIYIRSLTAMMLENVPFPPEGKKTKQRTFYRSHPERRNNEKEDSWSRSVGPGPGPAS